MNPSEILVRLPADQVDRFDPQRHRFRLAFAANDVVVLRRGDLSASEGRQRDVLRLLGSPVSLWTGDLLHALNLNHATGILVLTDGPTHKEIYLRNGDIIFAQSNLDEDRLGESLVRAGKIDQDQLDDAAKEIAPDRKLGRILVDRGLISPRELFLGVRRHVEEIVWSIFDWPARFLFYEGFANGDDVIELHLDTQQLLLDGIRRSQLWRHIPVEIPERQIMVTLAANPKNLGLNREERRIVALAATGATLRELVEQSGLGVLEIYKLVHHLLDRDILLVAQSDGVVTSTERRQRERRTTLENTVYNFASIFQDIIAMLKSRIGSFDVVERLNSFFDTLPDDAADVFGEVRFDADGTLDTGQIVANVQAHSQGRMVVLRAFNELLYFTLFEMKDHLSDDDTNRLMEIIENMEIF